MRLKSAVAAIVGLACLTLVGVETAAATCSLPYTFTNGQTADATQVMANLNALLACINSGSAPGGSANSLQYNAGGGNLGGISPLTSGQLAIGSTGNPPQPGAITAGAGITVTNGPGSITIGATGGGGATGLYNQVMSATPTSTGTGLTTWLNQGSATVADTPVGISITAPSSGGTGNVTGRYMPAPTTPYVITALLARTANSNSYNGAGLGWYDGSNKLHILSYVTQSGGIPYFEVEKWNNPTSFNATDFTSYNNAFSQPIWLQIADDGTNVSFAFSQDGKNFMQLFSTTKSSGFLGASGYSNVIFFVNPQGSLTYGTIMSWSQSS